MEMSINQNFIITEEKAQRSLMEDTANTISMVIISSCLHENQCNVCNLTIFPIRILELHVLKKVYV